MTAIFQPKPLAGTVRVPASKSQMHRCLIASALADGPTALQGLSACEDAAATVACLRALGARMEGASMHPRAGAPDRGVAHLHCGQSAATLRLLLPVAAALGVAARFTGEGGLPGRPLAPLLDCLCAHGVTADAQTLPLTVTGRLAGGHFALPGHISSQFISGILLALPLMGGGTVAWTTPLASAGYAHMTCQTMAQFSVAVQRHPDRLCVPPGQRYQSPGTVAVEGDWSAAAFWLAAGALGSPVGVSDLAEDSLQPDRAIVPLLRAFGARVWFDRGCFWAGPGRLQGLVNDVSGHPDLLPVLAVLGMAAGGSTRLTNAARLRAKESDRLQTTRDMVRALGGRAEIDADALVIHGTGAPDGGVVADARDHRLAMAAAIAASTAKGPTEVHGMESVGKSYPCFLQDYAALGGRYHVVDNR